MQQSHGFISANVLLCLTDLSQVLFSIVSNVWGKGGQALISQSAYRLCFRLDFPFSFFPSGFF